MDYWSNANDNGLMGTVLTSAIKSLTEFTEFAEKSKKPKNNTPTLQYSSTP